MSTIFHSSYAVVRLYSQGQAGVADCREVFIAVRMFSSNRETRWNLDCCVSKYRLIGRFK